MTMYGQVVSATVLTPQMTRVVLGGEGLEGFEPSPWTDAYVNCSFLPAEADYEVPFDPDAVRDLPAADRPRPRRMSVRRWDPERRELTLDIAVHGDVGFAGRWAHHVEPGDRLQFKGPAGDYRPHADADEYLFVGDESALPAISASAEAAPEGRPVTVVVEVQDADGEVEIVSPGALTVHWIHRVGHDETDRLLSDAVASLPAPAGVLSAFVHGEAVATRNVRRVLLSEKRVDLAHLSCSPYWRRGFDDEQWRQVKGDWVRQVNAETF